MAIWGSLTWERSKKRCRRQAASKIEYRTYQEWAGGSQCHREPLNQTMSYRASDTPGHFLTLRFGVMMMWRGREWRTAQRSEDIDLWEQPVSLAACHIQYSTLLPWLRRIYTNLREKDSQWEREILATTKRVYRPKFRPHANNHVLLSIEEGNPVLKKHFPEPPYTVYSFDVLICRVFPKDDFLMAFLWEHYHRNACLMHYWSVHDAFSVPLECYCTPTEKGSSPCL